MVKTWQNFLGPLRHSGFLMWPPMKNDWPPLGAQRPYTSPVAVSTHICSACISAHGKKRKKNKTILVHVFYNVAHTPAADLMNLTCSQDSGTFPGCTFTVERTHVSQLNEQRTCRCGRTVRTDVRYYSATCGQWHMLRSVLTATLIYGLKCDHLKGRDGGPWLPVNVVAPCWSHKPA